MSVCATMPRKCRNRLKDSSYASQAMYPGENPWHEIAGWIGCGIDRHEDNCALAAREYIFHNQRPHHPDCRLDARANRAHPAIAGNLPGHQPGRLQNLFGDLPAERMMEISRGGMAGQRWLDQWRFRRNCGKQGFDHLLLGCPDVILPIVRGLRYGRNYVLDFFLDAEAWSSR